MGERFAGIEVLVNNAPINEIMSVYNEKIEEDMELGDVEENTQEDELPIQTLVVPPSNWC